VAPLPCLAQQWAAISCRTAGACRSGRLTHGAARNPHRASHAQTPRTNVHAAAGRWPSSLRISASVVMVIMVGICRGGGSLRDQVGRDNSVTPHALNPAQYNSRAVHSRAVSDGLRPVTDALSINATSSIADPASAQSPCRSPLFLPPLLRYHFAYWASYRRWRGWT
jgi:hypothetical protein